jgi:hypothetical protein
MLSMRKTALSCLVILTFGAGPALAADCPANTVEDTVAAIRSAPSCKGAAAAYFACTRVTTQDVEFSEAAIEVCERNHVTRLSPVQSRNYRQAIRACERRYEQEAGTMYRSFEASCRVKAALRFSRS